MADKISLTRENIKYIRDAFSHFFPEDAVYSVDKSYVSGEFNWGNRRAFIDFVYRLTGVSIKSEKDFQSIKKAELAVEDLVKVGEKQEANTQTEEQREQAEKIRREREVSEKESAKEAKIKVEAAVKKQQELAEATKKAKVYVKTETPKPADLNEDQIKSIEALKSAAKTNPQKLTRDLTQVIEEKVKLSLPSDVSQQEANLIYKQTAYRIVTNLQGNSLAKESLIQNGISRDTKVLPKIISDKDTLAFFKYSGQSVSDANLLEYKLTRQLTSAAFGELFTNNIFGPENLGDIKVDLSATPKENFEPYDLSQIPSQYSDTLNNGGSLIGHLQSFGEGEIRSQFLSQAGTWLDAKIASLPADSLLAQTYNTEFVQGALTYFGLGNPVAWEGTTFLGRIAIENGLGPVLGWAQNLTGINFGISKAVSAVATEVVGDAVATTAATEVGAEVVAGTVGATVGAGAGIAIGQVVIPIPVVGAAIGAAVTWVVTKVAKIIPWQKIKDNLIAISGGMLAAGLLIFPGTVFGTVLSVGGGLGLIGGVVNGGLSGLGASLSGIAAGVGSFFGALGGAFLGAIGMPVLVTILVFPVVVALILFIINAGAYVVPSGTSGSSGGCSTAIANRAGVIANNLELGFDRYYNKSPDYPELWNTTLFAQNPNTPEGQIGADDMFWCNYMATKSFLATNEVIPFPLPTMVSYFKNGQGKWVDGGSGTYNDVCAGDAVFFYNSLDPAGSISHVGVVAGASSDGITTYESNAPYKPGWSYPTDSSGHFEVINLKTTGGQNYTINIIGFGKP